jgi:hypothetical protein
MDSHVAESASRQGQGEDQLYEDLLRQESRSGAKISEIHIPAGPRLGNCRDRAERM